MMDKEEGKGPNRWSWVPVAMPGVAKLIAERRARHGAAWVAECWERGVLKRQAGWFFAREGALAVGTPWEDPQLANFAALNVTRDQALLITREPEASHAQP